MTIYKYRNIFSESRFLGTMVKEIPPAEEMNKFISFPLPVCIIVR